MSPLNPPSRLLVDSHTRAPGATSQVLAVGYGSPSHCNAWLGSMNFRRIALQALASGLVARIVVADEANSPGGKLSVHTHPFVAVRRSFRTRFAIG